MATAEINQHAAIVLKSPSVFSLVQGVWQPEFYPGLVLWMIKVGWASSLAVIPL